MNTGREVNESDNVVNEEILKSVKKEIKQGDNNYLQQNENIKIFSISSNQQSVPLVNFLSETQIKNASNFFTL
jgi:hypothetical protein